MIYPFYDGSHEKPLKVKIEAAYLPAEAMTDREVEIGGLVMRDSEGEPTVVVMKKIKILK